MNRIRSLSWSLFQVFFWGLIIWLSFYFFMDNVIAFFYGYRSKNFGTTFFNNQFWMVLHLLGGTLTLVLGPTQFWPFIRNRYLAFHRMAGKAYMFGILLIGISVARLALVSSCIPCRISLTLLGLFAVLSTWFAWKAILGRSIKTHRQMMVRSYICVLGFVAVRLDQLLPMDFLFGSIEDPVFKRTVNEYFFSFVPLIIAEILMIWIPSVSRLKRRTK
ncbi:MAG TPA: DUF2306 domain-containing protein [Chitinophagaceae bacterium]|nr:DUF2306 domain-containing protein [Chitinophagaceae bacterium]